MTTDLVAILFVAIVQIAGLVALGWMIRSMRDQMNADEAALYLQGRRPADVIREMRESLQAALSANTERSELSQESRPIAST